MIANLDFRQLIGLLHSVFALRQHEKAVTILVDLPGGRAADTPEWADRRHIAAEWYMHLRAHIRETPFPAAYLGYYANVGSNNADLPGDVHVVSGDKPDISLAGIPQQHLDALLENSSVVLALTQYSATAPLKLLAKRHGFRGATLPGFTRSMLPTLALDYEKVSARVMQFKERMDRAVSAMVRFEARGMEQTSHFDLRHRTGHASGGLMREDGMVGNLPSGEAYIVPYEGELPQDASKTEGILPVQFDGEIVLYAIRENRAVCVESIGEYSDRERQRLLEEPAYGNIAELGIGVLGEWGVKAVGSTLLDEKLGLHVAFGRSDHFGGVTSPARFQNAANVVHIDWVYVPSVQPDIRVREVVFTYPDGRNELVMQNGQFTV